ncbi:MAG: hypothetical protein ACREEA_06025 [Stellaceae bacterium]
MIALQLALAGALLAMALSKFTRSASRRADIAARLPQNVAAPGSPAIRDLSGLDGAGAHVSVRALKKGERLATFVVRSNQADGDCEYWNRVAAHLLTSGVAVKLAAFCDGSQCSALAASCAKFPVITFAENVVLLRAAELDRDSSVLEMTSEGKAIQTFGWRFLPPSVTAARLAKR